MSVELHSSSGGAKSSALGGPSLVTALPSNPLDGQEVYYLADAAAGVVWHLRYRAASSSPYKWEAIGAPALRSIVATQETRALTSYGDLATIGPDVLAPLAGDYDVEFGATAYHNSATNIIQMAVQNASLGTTVSGDILWRFNNQMTHMRRDRLTVPTAGQTLRSRYANITGVDVGQWASRFLFVTPVRVG